MSVLSSCPRSVTRPSGAKNLGVGYLTAMVLPNAKPPPAQTATRAAEILARPMSSLPGADSEASGARGVAIALLIEAGAVLSSSLDPATTMDQVARLIVPRLADLCVVDLLEDDGSIRGAAVAARDEAVVAELEQLHERHPMDPDGDHPAARVIRTGEPILMPQIPDALLASYAEGSERARFVVAHEFRSAAVAPLVARDRTLGSVSILRLGNRAPYDAEDLVLVCELARRAALAIDNARLYARARGVEQRLDAVLAGLAEAVTVVDRGGRTIFANRAAADLLGVDRSTTSSTPLRARSSAASSSPTSTATSSTSRRCRLAGCWRGRTPRRCWCATSSAPPARSAG